MKTPQFLLLFVLSLLLGPLVARAQSFFFESEETTVVTFRNSAVTTVPLHSVAPAFASAAVQIEISPASSWLSATLSSDHTELHLGATGYYPESTSAEVTLKTANHQATLRVKRIQQSDLSNRGTVIDEGHDRLFSLHQGVLLAMEFHKPRIRDYFVLPASLLDAVGDHSLHRDPAGTDLLVDFPAAGIVARFDPATLALRATLAISSSEDAQPTRRVLAGVRNGLLYFLCHKPTPYPDAALHRYPTSHLEVRSLIDGALLQRLDLSSPSSTYPALLHLSGLAFHPSRPEAWLVAGHADEATAIKFRILRFALNPDGSIGAALGKPKLVLNRVSTGEVPTFPAPAFCPSRNLAAYLASLYDDETLDAVSIPSAPSYLSLVQGFSQDGLFAITRDGLLALETGDYFSLSDLGFGYAGTHTSLGLTSDNRHLVHRGMDDPRPRSFFLPKACAALAAAARRVPLADSTVLPTAELAWVPIPGADGYRVYLGEEGSAALLPLVGETTGESRLGLDAPLAGGRTYVWRVDTLVDGEAIPGAEQTFHVRGARFEPASLTPTCVAGAALTTHSFRIHAILDAPWRLESSQSWMKPSPASGVGPATVDLLIDARALSSPGQGVLTIVGSDGSASITVNIQTVGLNPSQTFEDQSTDAFFAFGEFYAASPIARIDAVDGQITHSRDMLAQDGFVIGDICYLPATDTLYATSASAPEVRSFSAADLTPRPQAGRDDNLVTTLPFSGASLRPAPDGHLWCVGANQIGLFTPGDPAPVLFALPQVENAYYNYYLTSSRVLEFTHISAIYDGTTFTAASYRITADGIVKLREGSFPRRDLYGSGTYAATASADLSLLLYKTVLMDGQLVMKGEDFTDLNSIVSPDGSMICGPRLLRFGADFGQARLVPPDQAPLAFHSATGRLLLLQSYSQVKSVAVDTLPLAAPVELTATENTDESLGLQIQWPSFTPSAFPTGSPVRVRYRPLGASDWLEWKNDYVGYTASPKLTWSFAPNSGPYSQYKIQADTAYEVSVRFESSDGANSFWSPVLITTTKTLHPRRNAPLWKEYGETNQGSVFSLNCATSGKDLVWTTSGLPPGLAIDPVTQTVSGVPTAPGSYTLVVKATNESGTFTWTTRLNVFASTLALPSARYAGIQIYDDDPLVGTWRITRSGQKFTGTVRTFVGSCRFVVDMSTEYDGGNHARQKLFMTKLAGVPVLGRLTWDTLLDQCGVFLGVEEFSSTSDGSTGYSTPFSRTAPQPEAGRYTGLSMADTEESGSPGPQGHGCFVCDLKPDGVMTIAYESALGQKITFSTLVGNNGSAPLFHSDTPGHHWGILSLDKETVGSQARVSGQMAWVRYTNRKSASYRDGFEQPLLFFGAPLPATGKKLPPLAPFANPDNRADFLLSGGGLDRLSKPIIQTLTPTATGLTAPKAGTPGNPNRVVVKLNAKTGLVTGSAAILDAVGKKVVRTQRFRGMLLKDPLGDGQDVIGGYFLLPDAKGVLQSGIVEISEPELEPAAETAPASP